MSPAYSKEDWQKEIHNGSTDLRYQEWVEHKIEADLEEIEAVNSSCE